MEEPFGTNGKAEDKSAAANSTIPVFQFSTATNVVYRYQTGPHGVPTAQTAGSPVQSACNYYSRRQKGCLRYALTACCLGLEIVRRRPSAGSVMGTLLVRPVPLPRRLPTAGDRLSFVRISIV